MSWTANRRTQYSGARNKFSHQRFAGSFLAIPTRPKGIAPDHDAAAAAKGHSAAHATRGEIDHAIDIDPLSTLQFRYKRIERRRAGQFVCLRTPLAAFCERRTLTNFKTGRIQTNLASEILIKPIV